MAFRSLIPFGRNTDVTRSSGDPFMDMRREMDRMFDEFARGWPALSGDGQTAGFLSPRVDVAETDDGLEITAELPGIEEGDIDLDLTDDVLTLRAEHSEEREERDENKRYHLVERSTGNFVRRFALPFEPDEKRVEARFKNGVLTVTVPRAEAPEKPRKRIEVKAG